MRELQGGRKRGHWMWFMFPQMKGLGFSHASVMFGISSKEEAEAYLEHPVLGPRLRDCTQLLMNIKDLSAHDIFGYPDDLKLHSSMTLFAVVSSCDSIFREAIQKYFSGNPDQRTLDLLKEQSASGTPG
jgi:uncharacterized protein (DUF1810 family)